MTEHVWVALNHYAYEGDDLIGVYATEDAAQRGCRRDLQHPDPRVVIVWDGGRGMIPGTRYHHYSVERVPVLTDEAEA